MNEKEISDVLKQLDTIPVPDKEKILSNCPIPSKKNATKNLKIKHMIAACIAVFCLISAFSVYVIAEENKEYNEALVFFREYDLETAGLSRNDIKKVYRDISTKKFIYGKTVEVIENSIRKDTIYGYELFQESPSQEDIENLWNYRNSIVQNKNDSLFAEKESIFYKFHSEYKFDSNLGFDIHDKSLLEKYTDGEKVWSVDFSDFWIEDYVAINDSVIVYGQTPTWSSTQSDYAWIAMIDKDGKILWEKMLQNGFESEYIGAIVPIDNTIAVFSRGDLEYLCLNVFNLNGEVVNFEKNKVGNYGIWNAAKLRDGYIVQLGSYNTSEHARVFKLNSKGLITDSFSYESENSSYYITDMIEYNDKIYLSAYYVPDQNKDEYDSVRIDDIAPVLNYIFDNDLMDIKSEELTKLVRDNFTAILLICDTNTGELQEFYSVQGSLGGKLSRNEREELLWNVESITDTLLSPYTSSFTISGSSYIYKYTFNDNGVLLSQEKTGEISDFRR